MREVLLALFLATAFLANSVGAALPACPEDSVLVGSGAFETGRWTAYECGPAVDDYDPAR